MKAIVLAGGIGKRMQPVQKDKCLLKFVGKELILHQIEALEKAGVKEFIIICNSMNVDKVKELVGKKAEYVVQQEAHGMADSLLSIKNPPREALIVGTSDILDWDAYRTVLEKKEGDSVLIGYKVKSYFPGGYLMTEGDRLKGMIEKPGAGNEPSDMINLVVHYHRHFDKLIETMKITVSDKDDVYEKAMDTMMKKYDFRVAPYEGQWVPLKFPWHVLDAAKFFMERAEGKIAPSATVSDKAVITGKVIIEDNVKIFENAVVRGPCYIGKNSVIGNNTLVWSGCHFGDRCVVGCGSEIKHSYFGDESWSHRNYIGDSVVADNCNFGAGTITANWRFDAQPISVNVGDKKISTGTDKFGCIMGEGSKTGVHVSIMPGVKIGPNSIIGAHVMVPKDVGPGRFVVLKETIEEKENMLKSAGSKEELLKKMMGEK
ncbi:MAG: NTP transferase domain-containing protein [Candidatus Aenigmatarchaeota archaeon]